MSSHEASGVDVEEHTANVSVLVPDESHDVTSSLDKVSLNDKISEHHPSSEPADGSSTAETQQVLTQRTATDFEPTHQQPNEPNYEATEAVGETASVTGQNLKDLAQRALPAESPELPNNVTDLPQASDQHLATVNMESKQERSGEVAEDHTTSTIDDKSEQVTTTTLSGDPAAPGAHATSNRLALADSSTVAAVAHAFGRESPVFATQVGLSDQATNKTLPTLTGLETISTQAETTTKPESGKTETEPTVEASSRGLKIGKGPPPATQASEELPFDFNRFLEQMKHRSAQPVGEYVRSFIKGFAKKPYRTQDQIKLIFDFLDFISARMRECEVWENLGETDFENAKEAMEKLVMNRLYPYTFTPAVLKEGRWAVQSDDLERDRVLKQRISLFAWLREEHLDIPVGDHSRGFIEFSIQELNKINHYKAPRDKLICILNCCKVIFGMIRHLSSQENADTFIPVLIFVVLKANPNNLISNVEYISRFRNPDRLSSESGYYLSSLMGAISFIETMDCTSLSNITQQEFETRVEEAMSALPLPEPEPQPSRSTMFTALSTPPRSLTPSQGPPDRQRTVSSTSVSSPAGPGDESAKALPFTPIAASLADDTRAFFQRTGEAARTGLSRPMGALGRLFNEGMEGIRTPSNLDSGASTERNNSPVPASAPGSTGMTASTSRSRIFAGLFGATETSEPGGSVRSTSSSVRSKQPVSIGTVGIDDEPSTPSTDGITQEGFVPYTEKPSSLQNAPARLLRPSVPQRGYSIDDALFDDELSGRRNLITTNTGRDEDDVYRDDYDDDELDRGARTEETPNAAAVERAKRRRQMQHDFGAGSFYPGTPSRTRAGNDPSVSLGYHEEQAYEHAQTKEAIQQSLVEQKELDAVQAQAEARNSAGVETLKSIFPTMDQAVIQMVLQGCEGNVELAIDRMLEMQ